MKLFLLSSIGERHEDRIPIGIFTSLENIMNHIHDDPNVSFTESNEIESDYDDKAVEIYVYFEDRQDGEEIDFDEQYIVESFDLDNKVNLNEAT